MEHKLNMAAQAMPLPQTSFATLEAKAEKRKTVRTYPRRLVRVASAAVLLICCLTTVYAFGNQHYGAWLGMHSNAYADVELLNRKFAYRFPEELGGFSFLTVDALHTAPEGESHLKALLSPTYIWYSLSYGDEEHEDTRVSVSVGSTERPIWKYVFSVADDGSCNYEGVEAGSRRTAEYRGYTLHIYSTDSSHSARWEDVQRSMVISVSMSGTQQKTQEDVLVIAKGLIDLNLQS